LGCIFSDNIRGDLTLDDRLDNKVNETHPLTGLFHETSVTSIVALANLYYDFRARDDFTPYIGARLGFSYNETVDQ
jgi:outer membrane protein W